MPPLRLRHPLLLLATLVIFATVAGRAAGFGGNGNPDQRAAADWRSIRCPEALWPFYLYRFPLLITDDSAGTRDWLGWYYVNACARELTADGRAIGNTYSNITVSVDASATQSELISRLFRVEPHNLLPLAAALDGLIAQPLPTEMVHQFNRIHIPHPEVYSAQVRQIFDLGESPLPSAVIPAVRNRLRAAGFNIITAPYREFERHPERPAEFILLGSSRSAVGSNAKIDFWGLARPGHFFNFEPAGAALDGATGGLGRVMLFPESAPDPTAVPPKIEVMAPAFVPCHSGSYPAQWRVNNEGKETAAALRTALVAVTPAGQAWTLRQGHQTYPPGVATETATVSIYACDQTATVTVELVLIPSGERISGQGSTRIGAEALPLPGQGQGSFGTGGTTGDHIIVPADCIPHPDPADRRLCTNYPDLVLP